MTGSEDTLTDFGRALGLGDFRWPDSGLAVFAFAARGTLYLETRDDRLLLYLSRECELRTDGRSPLETALRLCHYRHQWPFTVHCGLRDENQLVFLVSLPLRSVTLPDLEGALDLLTRLHDRVAQG